MLRLRRLFLASALVLAASPLHAQSSLSGQMQQGTPLAPSISSNVDTSSGVYFGPANHVGVTGHLESGAKATDVPVLSACGGTVAGDAGSTDTAGTATQGGTVTTCTITFGTPFVTKPACIVSDLTGTRASMASVASTTAITVTGITASDAIAWVCVGKSGG
jgi:hypothetical protein